MAVTTDGKIVQVGNSYALILPKIVCENYKLVKGRTLSIAMTDDGFFIPVKLTESTFIKKAMDKSLKALTSKGIQE